MDLTDPYAKRTRPSTRAILTPDLSCTFDEWKYNESGTGLIPMVHNTHSVLAIDGCQGLAGNPERTMRACEMELGTAGKSAYEFPLAGRPYAGFVRGSVKLFYALHSSGDFRLYGVLGIGRSQANLIEIYPGAAWRILNSRQWPPKKTTICGIRVRLGLLIRYGLTFPALRPDTLPTHDELDAAVAAYIAYLFVNGQTMDFGEPPFEDIEDKVMREGFIVQPSERIGNVVSI